MAQITKPNSNILIIELSNGADLQFPEIWPVFGVRSIDDLFLLCSESNESLFLYHDSVYLFPVDVRPFVLFASGLNAWRRRQGVAV